MRDADHIVFITPDGSPSKVEVGEAVLALPSHWCFSARMANENGTGASRGRTWRRGLLFDLEEKLPLAAEEMTADFLVQGDQVLGVCVRTEQVAPVINALEQAGSAVSVVCPAAMLALQTLLDDTTCHSAHAVLIAEEDQLNLFVVTDAEPSGWHLLPAGAQDVAARLALLMPAVERPVVCAAGIDDTLQRGLEAAGLTIIAPSATMANDVKGAAAAAAHAILASRRRPILNLRRDALAPPDPLRKVRRPLQAATAGVAVLLVALTSAWLIAAQRYDAITDKLNDQQARLYRELMPEASRVPQNVARRLASEHRAMLSRTTSGDSLPTAGSALMLLRDTFERLPADFPYQLQRVRLDDHGVELVGQVRSHQDAGRFANALGADGLLRVEPARTHALRDRGVGFTITAQAARMVSVGPGGAP